MHRRKNRERPDNTCSSSNSLMSAARRKAEVNDQVVAPYPNLPTKSTWPVKMRSPYRPLLWASLSAKYSRGIPCGHTVEAPGSFSDAPRINGSGKNQKPVVGTKHRFALIHEHSIAHAKKWMSTRAYRSAWSRLQRFAPRSCQGW